MRDSFLAQARTVGNTLYGRIRHRFYRIFPRHHGRAIRPSFESGKFEFGKWSTGELFSCVIGSGDPSREAFMRGQLAQAGLENSIWLMNPNRPDVPPDLIRAFKLGGAQMTEGEFSATLKHFMALHLFLQSESDVGLVMEDRIEFLGDFATRLSRYRAGLPAKADILFEGDMVRIPGYGRAYSRKPEESFYLLKMRREAQDWAHGASNGANCYLVSRKAAEQIVTRFLPFGKVIDHHLNDIIRQARLNVFWPMPPAVHRRDIPSTVQVNLDGSTAPQVA